MKIDLNKITKRQKLIIAKGLCDYKYIMDNFEPNDNDFQEVYYSFYLKARWAVMKKVGNKEPYFQKLQSTSKDDSLIDILIDLKEKMETKSYEFSLASKLLHTINDSLPIYDSKVRKYLSQEEGKKFWWHINSSHRSTEELEKINHDWIILCDWYKDFLESPRGKEWINWFDSNFPSYTNISNVKKIDFIIFATN